MTRRLGAIVGALAIVLMIAVGTVAAGGFGKFVASIANGGGQQGGAVITGVCQDSLPIALEFQTAYDETSGEFVVDGIHLSGINAACVAGALVVNGLASSEEAFTATAGTASVTFDPTYPLGEIDQVDVLLTEE